MQERERPRPHADEAYTPVDFEHSLALIKGEIDLTSWTKVLQLEEGQRAFNTITESPGGTLKMVLQGRVGL